MTTQPSKQSTTKTSTIPDTVTNKAVIVWAVGVFAYIMAVLSRTSFGVVGVEAMDQFEINAGQLAVFTTVQLATYAAAQIPTGILVDKFGPRKLILVGAIIMAIGQVVLGTTDNYYVAVGARVFIGAGDATAFLSVMRLIPAWFPLQRAPIFGQATGALGQLGQFLSAVPFVLLVGASGWQVGFYSLGAIGIIVGIAAVVFVKDTPAEAEEKSRRAIKMAEKQAAPPRLAGGMNSPLVAVKYAFTNRSAWHGFFIHWAGLSLLVVFTLLWGMPIMTLGMGLSKSVAGWALSASTLVMAISGVLVGFVSARLGRNRWKFILLGTSFGALCWFLFFLPTNPRGAVGAFIINIVMGLVSPLANIGFDSVREECKRQFVATATGLANMGGWVAGMIASQAMGIWLTYAATDGNYTWAEFRIGWFIVLAVWLVGLVGVYLTRPRPAILARKI